MLLCDCFNRNKFLCFCLTELLLLSLLLLLSSRICPTNKWLANIACLIWSGSRGFQDDDWMAELVVVVVMVVVVAGDEIFVSNISEMDSFETLNNDWQLSNDPWSFRCNFGMNNSLRTIPCAVIVHWSSISWLLRYQYNNGLGFPRNKIKRTNNRKNKYYYHFNESSLLS